MQTDSTTLTAPASASLAWSEQLAVGDARMDETHAEFVDQLNALLATPVDQQLPLYRAFLDHTVEHFAQEERWMLATGFAPDNCHASHHATILETMRAVIPHFENDDPEIITRPGRSPGRMVPATRRQHGRWPGATPQGSGLRHHHRNPGRPFGDPAREHERVWQRELQLTLRTAGQRTGITPGC